MNKYHLSLFLQFKQDVDLDALERKIGIMSYKKFPLAESRGKNKTAKIWFKTEDTMEPDTFEVVKNFIYEFKSRFEFIKKILDEFDGTSTLTLYYDEVDDKPYIRLSAEIMKILAENNVDFEVEMVM